MHTPPKNRANLLHAGAAALLRALFCLLLGLGSLHAQAFSLEDLSGSDASGGLKQALGQGIDLAVNALGKEDGFLANPKVRIPLPGNLGKASGMLRTLGMGKQLDTLETTMNRAAEAAVPQARSLLADALKKMTLTDAKGILSGGEDAATQYFKRSTSSQLFSKFQPVIKASVSRLKLATQYNQLAGQAAQLGLIDKNSATLDGYVTQKALDGLFTVIAEEEKSIRSNPAQAAGNLAQKVFGLLK